VYPEVVAVMQEQGIDLSGARPQKLTAETAAQAQLLITMGAATSVRTCLGCAAKTGRSRIQRVSQLNASGPFATIFALESRLWSIENTQDS
jgi:protein-tyrosine-phosphatase